MSAVPVWLQILGASAAVLGAIVTTGGVLLALSRGREDRQRYEVDRTDRAVEIADQQAAQARLIRLRRLSDWGRGAFSDDDRLAMPYSNESVVMVDSQDFVVTNHSLAPIFNVELAEVRLDSYRVSKVGEVHCRARYAGRAWTVLSELVPNEQNRISIEVWDDGHTNRPATPFVRIRFEDQAGLRWERDETGEPRRLTE